MPGGQTIGWNENSPANSDPAGNGDDEIRSLKSNVRGGLAAEHNWSSTGGANTGYHTYGSARPYFGTISQCSSDGTDARLFTTSDTSEVYSLSSLGAFPVGGAFSLLAANANGVYMPGSKAKLAVKFGTATTDSKSSVIVTFNSAYSGVPVVFFAPPTTFVAPTTPSHVRVLRVSAGSFEAIVLDGSSTTATWVSANVQWLSIGTVASGTP